MTGLTGLTWMASSQLLTFLTRVDPEDLRAMGLSGRPSDVGDWEAPDVARLRRRGINLRPDGTRWRRTGPGG
jgi:hypothetical protein